MVENPEEIPDEDGDVREERNKIAAIMAHRWEFPLRDGSQEGSVVGPDSLNPDPDPAFQVNSVPDPGPGFNGQKFKTTG